MSRSFRHAYTEAAARGTFKPVALPDSAFGEPASGRFTARVFPGDGVQVPFLNLFHVFVL